MTRMKIKKLTKDFALNLLASFFVTGILQLFVYPLLAHIMSSERYGILLTMVGLANTFAATIGSSLNNTRLLLNEEYDEKKYNGDFLPILAGSSAIGLVILFFALKRYEDNSFTYILLLIYMVLNAVRTYGSVAYRIRMNYINNLICNVIVGMGYLVGTLFLFIWKELCFIWPVCFLNGEVAAIIYLLFSCNILKEKYNITPLFKKTLKKDSVLMTTTLTANLLIYLDRILLLPILGGSAVTTYTVASIFGKSIGILMAPLAGVLLSYFAQKDFEMDRKKFWMFNFINIGFTILFMLIGHLIGYWFTGIFYPTEIDSARAFLDVANSAAIVLTLGNMTQPTVLKYSPSYWLLIIQILYCICYLVGGVLAVRSSGLMGFSYVALFAACLKVILQLIVGHKYVGIKRLY